MKEKLFVIRKYIKAKDIQEAIKKEVKQKPDDVWVDEDWKKMNCNINDKKCGF